MVIEDRADSLNRFLQAYQQLSRLPQPSMQRVRLRDLVNRTVPLETRVRVDVPPSPDVALQGDSDQLQQVLINLLKNAADAALDPESANRSPQVTLQWTAEGNALLLQVVDNGPGLANPDNLFVPFYTTKQQGAGHRADIVATDRCPTSRIAGAAQPHRNAGMHRRTYVTAQRLTRKCCPESAKTYTTVHHGVHACPRTRSGTSSRHAAGR